MCFDCTECLREKVPCIDNGKFYRNPNRDIDAFWSTSECSKYYLCIENEVSDTIKAIYYIHVNLRIQV